MSMSKNPGAERPKIDRMVVFLPGAWGNRTVQHVAWWFKDVEDFLRDEGLLDVAFCATYKGTNLDEIVDDVYKQIKEAKVPNGSMVVAYSMGAQVLRGLAAKDPDLFGEKILICGLERGGFRIVDILKVFRTSPLLVLRSLFGTVPVLKRWQIKALFFGERLSPVHVMSIKENMHPETFYWKIAEVFLPGFRRRMPPLTKRNGPITAFVGASDALVGAPEYWGEDVDTTTVIRGAGHALIQDARLIARMRDHFMLRQEQAGQAAAGK